MPSIDEREIGRAYRIIILLSLIIRPARYSEYNIICTCIFIFLLQKYGNIKKNFLKLKFYINRIFTPESITLHENYDAKIMMRKS